MSSADDQNTTWDSTEIYTKRWFLLAATFVYTASIIFLSKSFSIANEIWAVYFQVSLAAIDWACLGLYVGSALVTPVFAYLCFTKVIGFRSMSICGSLCLLLSCSCILVAIKYPSLFPIMVGVNLLQGVAYCVSFSAGAFFAVLWFPDNQVSLAIAFNSAAAVSGGILGSIIPPALLKNPKLETMLENTSTFLHNNTEFMEWNKATNKTLTYIYLTVEVILFFLLLFFCMFAKDLPPKPPTLAQAKKRIIDATLNGTRTWNGFVTCTKELFQDRTYLLIAVLTGIAFNLVIIEMLHLSQLVNVVIGNSKTNTSASLVSGFIILAFAITAFLSAFLSNRILLYFQRHTVQIIVGTGMLLGSVILTLVSYYGKFLPGFFIGNIWWGLSVRICVIPLLDVVTRHTYPKDETVVSVWVTGFCSTSVVLLAGTARLLTKYTKPESALISLVVIMFFVFSSTFFLKPNDNRGEAGQELISENQTESESSRLLSN